MQLQKVINKKFTDEIAGSGSGSVSLRYRSAVPKCDGSPVLLNLFMTNKGKAERGVGGGCIREKKSLDKVLLYVLWHKKAGLKWTQRDSYNTKRTLQIQNGILRIRKAHYKFRTGYLEYEKNTTNLITGYNLIFYHL